MSFLIMRKIQKNSTGSIRLLIYYIYMCGEDLILFQVLRVSKILSYIHERKRNACDEAD